MTNSPTTRLGFIFCGGIGGAIAVFGWAPFNWKPLALVGYALLFWLLQLNIGTATAWLTGLAFGVSLHAAGHGWIYVALRTEAGLGSTMASAAMLIFVVYLALFTALPCALMGLSIQRVRPRNPATAGWIDSVCFAALLTIGEWARSTLFNGFTSLSVGYVALDTWLAAFAPLGGLYLASFATFLLAASLGSAIRSPARAFHHGAAALAILTMGWAMTRIEWERPIGAPLSYRLIQSNSDGHNSVLFHRSRSSICSMSPDRGADGFARYDKARLMPFGEYTPAGFSWFTKSLVIPLKDMSSGPADQRPLVLTKNGTVVRIGTLICLEDTIGRDAVRWAPLVDILLNPTNLSWFETAAAINQRLQIARMRSLEIARPLLRVADVGITAQIGPHGEILSTIPAHTEGVLSGFVQPTTGLTPYARTGDGLVLTLCGLGMLPMVFRLGRKTLPGGPRQARPFM